ncbi:hypothetical protein Ccrd_010236 [Cynara cardunculus var. scolymus]|uniref:MYST zinc finger domain-containing protein n=1 Tax=Cynara cardunculus var. scolymus TaxID=59895 RepID=A0A103YLM9_CYNCS|nr:hypothetical protein Ccrd_010236 [Cynara cardunculus var. scolymus]
MTRHQKRKINETRVTILYLSIFVVTGQYSHGHEAASLREHEELVHQKYNDSPNLYFCEFCMNFMKRKKQLQRHMTMVPPPIDPVAQKVDSVEEKVASVRIALNAATLSVEEEQMALFTQRFTELAAENSINQGGPPPTGILSATKPTPNSTYGKFCSDGFGRIQYDEQTSRGSERPLRQGITDQAGEGLMLLM